MSSSPLTLNLDVLDVILSFANPYDALQFSMTCRDGHKLAMPHFLEEVEFPLPWLCLRGAKRSALADPELFEGFRAYMLDSPHASHRLRKLKALQLGEEAFCVEWGERDRGTVPPTDTFTLAEPLADVIRGAVELRRISIHYSEAIFDDVPQLIDAIASLPRLQEVCFYGADVSTLGLLSRMQSRLRRVELRIIEYNDQETRERWWGDYAFGNDRFLHNFTESLQVLSLHGGLDIIEELEPHTVWRAVRELKLVRGNPVNLQAMARAFPNLRRLHTEPGPSAVEPAIHQWRKLDTVWAAHPLPLQHPVRHLIMHWTLQAYRYLAPPFNQALAGGTIAMLQHTLPVVLECSADKNTYACIAHHAPSVRCMRITVVPSERQHGHDWNLTDEEAKNVLIDEFSLLRALPLKGIAIVLQGHGPWGKASNWKQYSCIIGACIPSLEYIGLRTQTGAWFSHDDWDAPEPYQWYQVTGRPEHSEVVVESLSADEGVRVCSTLFSMSRGE
ncbi:uncharacterized protein B0H18DRAFT_17997 [Fomitopsis serialis]|uniref:uncharacterized protein n=1 Tax=Fomitopsis serialis TaxID=139415 RepID=UPI002007D7A0|nr:uncharacterized protein B0H18DRAFT_17997 [Neoantrodia serialis]KAH9938525.1 hypothetical protein B0H18DRAFT_17997 [Neoantrodia serialis]